MATSLSWPSVRTLCSIFCCPPLPSKIAAKLAFVPPPATYTLRPIDGEANPSPDKVGTSKDGEDEEEKKTMMKLELFEDAEWQFSEKELAMIEATTCVTSRGETIACIYVHTQQKSK